jgi:hypothetical protein
MGDPPANKEKKEWRCRPPNRCRPEDGAGGTRASWTRSLQQSTPAQLPAGDARRRPPPPDQQKDERSALEKKREAVAMEIINRQGRSPRQGQE